MVRVDHRFTGRDSGFIRYNIDDGVTTSALGGRRRSQHGRLAACKTSSWKSRILFSPYLINEAEFGFNRNTYIQTQVTGSPLNIVISGFSEIYENYSKEQVGQSFSFNDTVTMTHGLHTIKAGVDIRFPQYNEQNSLDCTANFSSPHNLPGKST